MSWALKVPAHEQDVYRLIHRYESAVADGAPANLATFRGVWQDLSFSYVFEVRTQSPSTAPCTLAQPCPVMLQQPCERQTWSPS